MFYDDDSFMHIIFKLKGVTQECERFAFKVWAHSVKFFILYFALSLKLLMH